MCVDKRHIKNKIKDVPEMVPTFKKNLLFLKFFVEEQLNPKP